MKYSLQAKAKNEDKFKDIRQIKEWPNSVLVKTYDEAKEAAIVTEKELEKLGMYEKEKKDELSEKYRLTLKLIEFLEDKGRERKIVHFLSWEEVEKMCKRIFFDKREFKLVSNGGHPASVAY